MKEKKQSILDSIYSIVIGREIYRLLDKYEINKLSFKYVDRNEEIKYQAAQIKFLMIFRNSFLLSAGCATSLMILLDFFKLPMRSLFPYLAVSRLCGFVCLLLPYIYGTYRKDKMKLRHVTWGWFGMATFFSTVPDVIMVYNTDDCWYSPNMVTNLLWVSFFFSTYHKIKWRLIVPFSSMIVRAIIVGVISYQRFPQHQYYTKYTELDVIGTLSHCITALATFRFEIMEKAILKGLNTTYSMTEKNVGMIKSIMKKLSPDRVMSLLSQELLPFFVTTCIVFFVVVVDLSMYSETMLILTILMFLPTMGLAAIILILFHVKQQQKFAPYVLGFIIFAFSCCIFSYGLTIKFTIPPSLAPFKLTMHLFVMNGHLLISLASIMGATAMFTLKLCIWLNLVSIGYAFYDSSGSILNSAPWFLYAMFLTFYVLSYKARQSHLLELFFEGIEPERARTLLGIRKLSAGTRTRNSDLNSIKKANNNQSSDMMTNFENDQKLWVKTVKTPSSVRQSQKRPHSSMAQSIDAHDSNDVMEKEEKTLPEKSENKPVAQSESTVRASTDEVKK